MRKSLTVLALLSMVALPAFAQASVPGGTELPEGETTDEVTPAPPAATTAGASASQSPAEGAEEAFEPQPTALPPCSLLVGTACTPPGSTAWCQWRPGEPELCTCESDGVWHCGNLP